MTFQQKLSMAERHAIIKSACEWHDAGCVVLPATPDGSKRPRGRWKAIRDGHEPAPSIDEVIRLIGHELSDGISVICGACSGHLEMIEADTNDVELIAEVYHNIEHAGLADVWDAIRNGVEERTPSGGIHWFLRTNGPALGNLKLAWPEPTGDSVADAKATFETRGQGGQVIAACSGGRTHPSGKFYAFTKTCSGPSCIPTITIDQRDRLLDCFRATCRRPVVQVVQKPCGEAPPPDSVGNRFIGETSWRDVLSGAGWLHVANQDDAAPYPVQYWRRPGKTHGISGITGGDKDVFYPFTSTTDAAELSSKGTQRPFDRYQLFVRLHFGGDYTAATRTVARANDAGHPMREIARNPRNYMNTDGTVAIGTFDAWSNNNGQQSTTSRSFRKRGRPHYCKPNFRRPNHNPRT